MFYLDHKFQLASNDWVESVCPVIRWFQQLNLAPSTPTIQIASHTLSRMMQNLHLKLDLNSIRSESMVITQLRARFPFNCDTDLLIKSSHRVWSCLHPREVMNWKLSELSCAFCKQDWVSWIVTYREQTSETRQKKGKIKGNSSLKNERWEV